MAGITEELLCRKTIDQIKELAEEEGIEITETRKDDIIKEFLSQIPGYVPKAEKKRSTMSADTFVRSRGMSSGWVMRLNNAAKPETQKTYAEWNQLLENII